MNELLARARAAWDSLLPRERALVGAAGGAFAVVLLWLAVVTPLSGAAGKSREDVEVRERELELMLRLRREYDGIAGRLGTVEARIRGNRDQRGLRTLLEELAARSAVTISSMQERNTPDGEGYEETKLEISLKGVTLTQAVNYLHNIESERRLLSVKTVRIRSSRSRNEGAELLDVTFTVSAFESA